MEHSSSRDGTTGWPTSPDYISQTLDVIDFLASRYALDKLVYCLQSTGHYIKESFQWLVLRMEDN